MGNALSGSNIVGIVLLVLGALMLWKKKSIKVITWLWVGAGFTVAGDLVTGLQNIMREAAKTAGGPVGLGVSAGIGIIGCALMWIVWHEVPLRKGRGLRGSVGEGGAAKSSGGKKYTPFLGLLAPILMLATTGYLGSLAKGVGGFLGRLGGPLATFFGA